jgi:hypothetical protein
VVTYLMTLARLLPLHVHGALEVLVALVIMAAPFVLGFEPAAMIACVLLGALVIGVAFATHIGDDALPISTHAAFDIAFAIALGVGAVAFAIVDDGAAAVFMAGSSVSLILLSSLTRYSPSHA